MNIELNLQIHLLSKEKIRRLQREAMKALQRNQAMTISPAHLLGLFQEVLQQREPKTRKT